MPSLSNKSSKGFTIVEVVVAIAVMGLLAFPVLDALGSLYSGNVTSSIKSVQETDTRSVLRSIETELSNSLGWTTSLPVSAPYGPTNSTTSQETWSYCGRGGAADCANANANRVLIAYVNATDRAPNDPARLPVFAYDAASNCNPANTIFTVQVAQIYFVAPDRTDPSKNSLYRRSVLNPARSQPCGNASTYQKTTCATTVINSPLCKDDSLAVHTDALLVKDVTSFKIDYYAPNNSVINNPYSASAATINASTSVRLTIETNRWSSGSYKTESAAIRINQSSYSGAIAPVPVPPPPPTRVTFDATGAGYTSTTPVANISGSWSHTASLGAAVIVAVAARDQSAQYSGHARSATYGGLPMTSLGVRQNNNVTKGWTELFGLIGVPGGAKTVQITVSNGSTVEIVAASSVSYTGVSSFGAAVTNIGIGMVQTSGNISSNTTGMVAQAFGLTSINSPLNLSSYNQANRFQRNLNAAAGKLSLIHGDAPGAATVSFTATSAVIGEWSSIAVPLVF